VHPPARLAWPRFPDVLSGMPTAHGVLVSFFLAMFVLPLLIIVAPFVLRRR